MSAVPAKFAPVTVTAARPPRLWPAILLTAGCWMAWLYSVLLAPTTFQTFLTQFYSPMVLAAGLLVWWPFFSRMRWLDRGLGLGALAIGAGLTYLVVDKSMVMG